MENEKESIIKFTPPTTELDTIDLNAQKFDYIADSSKKSSMQIQCRNCLMDITTTVESNKCCDGKTWAMLCGCIGSCYGIYLILSGKNGFKEYTHYCPSCHTVVGIYKPRSSAVSKLILLLAILGIITLKVIGFIYIVLPKLENK